MSIELWGRSTWILLHTLAEKVKEEYFLQIRGELLGMFLNLFSNLPCPDCKQHALQFWKNVNPQKIMTKQQLIDVLWVFHNSVNDRKRYKKYKKTELYAYKVLKLPDVFKVFLKHFNTRGNEKMMADEEQRKRFLTSFIKWFTKRAGYFIFTSESLENAKNSILNNEQNVDILKQSHLDKIKQLENEISSLNLKTTELNNKLSLEQQKLNQLIESTQSTQPIQTNSISQTSSVIVTCNNGTICSDDESDELLSTATSNLSSLADEDALSVTYDGVYDNLE